MELTKYQRITLSNAKLLGSSLYEFVTETHEDIEDTFNNLKWTLSNLDPQIAGRVVQYILTQVREGGENVTPIDIDEEGYFVLAV